MNANGLPRVVISTLSPLSKPIENATGTAEFDDTAGPTVPLAFTANVSIALTGERVIGLVSFATTIHLPVLSKLMSCGAPGMVPLGLSGCEAPVIGLRTPLEVNDKPWMLRLFEFSTYTRLPWTVRLFGNCPPELTWLTSCAPCLVTRNELTVLLPALTANRSFPLAVLPIASWLASDGHPCPPPVHTGGGAMTLMGCP